MAFKGWIDLHQPAQPSPTLRRSIFSKFTFDVLGAILLQNDPIYKLHLHQIPCSKNTKISTTTKLRENIKCHNYASQRAKSEKRMRGNSNHDGLDKSEQDVSYPGQVGCSWSCLPWPRQQADPGDDCGIQHRLEHPPEHYFACPQRQGKGPGI